MAQTESTGGFFGVKTLWTAIIKIQEGDEATRRAARDRLVTRYRQPILACFRTRWRPDWPEPAEDLAHDFICKRLLADCFFREISPEHGRFRAFVKACIENFIREKLKEWGAAKRNKGRPPASLDETDGEGNRRVDPVGTTTLPGDAIDRAWADAVLDNALAALEPDSIDARGRTLFLALRAQLGRVPESGTAAEIGARVGMSESAVNTAMNRLRKRLGELIAAEVRQTVGPHEDWREELRYLVELMGRGAVSM